MPASLSYKAAPATMQDTNVILIGIFFKVGIKTRDGKSLKFQLKGQAVWHRELLSFKTCKGGPHENSLSPSSGFHSPQEKKKINTQYSHCAHFREIQTGKVCVHQGPHQYIK